MMNLAAPGALPAMKLVAAVTSSARPPSSPAAGGNCLDQLGAQRIRIEGRIGLGQQHEAVVLGPVVELPAPLPDAAGGHRHDLVAGLCGTMILARECSETITWAT